jgi:hypothetical protein
MHHPTRPRFHMGCGEPLSGSLRRFRELVRMPGTQVAGKRQLRTPNGGRAGR